MTAVTTGTAKERNEAELIARILSGEKDLFHDLIRPYERMLYLTAFSIVKNETDAEECAQDAVVNAYRNLAKFRGDSKFSTWLVTIVVNDARKKLRKAKRAKEESLDEVVEGEGGEDTPVPRTDGRGVL